jgi:peptide/nickel transport system substrate-binding protein
MKRLTTLALALLATLVLGTTFAQQRGGQLVFGRYADSLFLDPVLNDANLDIWVLTNLYDPLLQPTADGKDVAPDLATAWSFSSDGLTLTLTLRDGIKFADGSPITAQDAKWSLDRARNPDNGIWNFTLAAIDSIDASGNKVIIHLKHPDPTIVPALSMFNAAIMPEKLFEAAKGSTDAEKAKAFAEHPIGSGPFVLSEWKRGSYMVITRNPYYWEKGTDGKALPYLDSIRFEIVPDDATRILKLQSRELDAAEFIPLSRVGELQKDPNINMELFPSTQVNSVLMNNRPTLPNGTPNPLSSLEVRQALNYATNKQALIQVVNFGIGTPMQSFMSTTTPYYVATRSYAYDLEKAKSLLAQAGFPNGFTVSALATAGSQNDLALLTALQSMWGEVGIKLKIEQLDAATKTERYRNNDFQMRTAGWTNDINDPSEITSYFAVYENIQSLHTGFKSAEIDKLFAESQQELDKTKRAEEYKQIQKIFMDAAPIVFLYETPYPVAIRKTVTGLNQIPLGNYIFKTAYKTTN